ncbi:hypothetical protein SNE510_55330 [Streptomyces sp. NE5-10]|uniref:hypothetical protein n=1 Tax=Streptomyces sp. NE5-10 TaxID=2759674 RepID=UPI001902E56A|nr:hypothetical protein [Streptomyces sp. NE5-10]GHJ96014.1 hypothetical protein SNE510_55330 [Streptomyces sp. NE5-10]
MAAPTHTPPLPRLLKAAVVTALAIGAAHLILSDTLRFALVAEASAALGSPTGYGTAQVFTTALFNTALVMPIVLWTGMRLSGERRLGAMVLVGSVGWIVVVWRGVDGLDDSFGAILPLRPLALLVGFTALASLLRRRPSPAPSAPRAPQDPSAPIRPGNVSETTPAS